MHKIALIGAGRIGRIHAANVAAHPNLQLAYVDRSGRGCRQRRGCRVLRREGPRISMARWRRLERQRRHRRQLYRYPPRFQPCARRKRARRSSARSRSISTWRAHEAQRRRKFEAARARMFLGVQSALRSELPRAQEEARRRRWSASWKRCTSPATTPPRPRRELRRR